MFVVMQGTSSAHRVRSGIGSPIATFGRYSRLVATLEIQSNICQIASTYTLRLRGVHRNEGDRCRSSLFSALFVIRSTSPSSWPRTRLSSSIR